MLLCFQCLISFNDPAEFKKHCKTDFHEVNVKRCSEKLEPLLFEEYQQQISSGENAQDLTDSNLAATGNSNHKKRRNKQTVYNLSNGSVNQQRTALDDSTMLNKNAIEQITETSTDAYEQCPTNDDNDDDSALETLYTTNMSLFNNHVCDSFEENLEYMKHMFSFRIPDEKYCIDIEGFIQYLGEKVYLGGICLKCNKNFASALAVQQHMLDAGHRRIGLKYDEQLEDYAYFYDYSDSYKDLNLPSDVVDKISSTIDSEQQQDVTWEEKLKEIGYRKPTILQDNNLLIQTSNKVIINRANLKQPDEKYVDRNYVETLMSQSYSNEDVDASTDETTRQKPDNFKHLILCAINKLKHNPLPSIEERKSLIKAMKDNVNIKSKHDVRLSTKANLLYRYIARKNKIFL